MRPLTAKLNLAVSQNLNTFGCVHGAPEVREGGGAARPLRGLASKQASKQARKQARKQASKEASKQASKQASKKARK